MVAVTDASFEPCFFLLGYGRSGTTLFRRMLSAHPELFVPPENDVFQWVPPRVRTTIRTEPQLRRLVAEMPGYYSRIYDLDQFVDRAVQVLPLTTADLIAVLQGCALIAGGKPQAVWGHKAPSEWPFVQTWRRWFPQSRFIHVVRHPQDSTASMVQYQLQRYPTTPLVALWQWRRAFRSIQQHGAALGPSRFHTVRYEDLVSEPDRVLGETCRFLEVDVRAVPRMIDFLSDPSAAHVDEGEHMERTNTGLTQERIGRAGGDYSDGQMAMADYLCGRELAMMGYEQRASMALSRSRALKLEAEVRLLDAAWAGLRASRRARGQL